MQELTWKQEALYRLMSDISEDCWCAGWLTGNEYTLWEVVANPNAERRYGQGEVTERDIIAMREMSAEIGGWVRWHDDSDEPDLPSSEWGIRFIAMPDWLAMYEKRMTEWAELRATLKPEPAGA